MKDLKVILFLFILIGVITSCQRDIDIEYGSFESKLVVNSTFNPDSVFTIHLSKTGSLGSDKHNIESVNYANVFISTDDPLDSVRTMYHSENGQYIAYNYYPEENKTYFLEAHADGFPSVYASNAIPDKVDITLYDTTTVYHTQGQALQFDLTIDNDNNNTSDFLIYDIVNTNRSVKGNNPFSVEGWLEAQWLSSTSSDTDRVNDSDNLQTKIFQVHNGQSSGSLNSSFITYEDFDKPTNGDTTSVQNGKVMLRIMSVSEDLYNYSKSIEYYKLNDNVNSNQTTPLEIFSNVEGGYGIFGGYSQTLFEL